MRWYEGNVAEAVALSKQRNAIFVVFVQGSNEQSTQMATMLEDKAVLHRLSNHEQFLAVKLESGSNDYVNFAKIYQLVPVPSLFFIGRNGIPLEVVCEGVQASYLATRIDRILEDHFKDIQTPVQSSSSAIKQQTTSLLQAEAAGSSSACSPARDNEPDTSGPAAKVPKMEEEFEVVCTGDVCVRQPKKHEDPKPSTSSQPSVAETAAPAVEPQSSNIEEKLERAKELIEARRKEKMEKEKELEKQKEKERRATGQGVNQLKQWQADQELKQMQEERKREKMENNMARQRVLEQIAQDRAERRARENPITPPPLPNTSHTAGDGIVGARVQFKLSDGSSHAATFAPTDTIGAVHQYVAENIQMQADSFSLWTAFPRRELTDLNATLLDMELAPSAALLVLPRRQTTAVSAPTAFSNIITFFTQFLTTFVLEPLTRAYNWILSRPELPPRGSPAPRRPSAPRGSPGLRRRGVVHRLPTDSSNNDDNNTWNGNSTQQM